MYKLCVFAGTTEGRELIELLEGESVSVTACVATEYGGALLEPRENLTVSLERLTREEMEELFTREGFALVVDATHPYAAAVTENIAAACEGAAQGWRPPRIWSPNSARPPSLPPRPPVWPTRAPWPECI